MKEIITDVLIVGAGAAGLSAAVYAARAGKKTLVLKGKARSHLELAHKVENYPGLDPMSGTEMLKRMENQAVNFGVEVLSGDAIAMNLGSDPKMVSTRNELITAGTVILAMGKGEHKRSVPDEDRYLGAGVSYCAICDGAFYRGKKVAVYGSDHEAVEDAKILHQLGCQVTLLLYCRDKSCPDSLVESARNGGVTVIQDTEITGIEGDGTLNAIRIKNTEGDKKLDISGLFIIQEVPSLPLLTTAGVNLTNKDCIAVNRSMETNIPGVFAAGDITCGGLQAVIAAGEGATAGLGALKYLRSMKT